MIFFKLRVRTFGWLGLILQVLVAHTLVHLATLLPLHAQNPTVSEVIKFDSPIQDEPRIRFSKGVEESVAPTTGALTVKASIVTLQGRALPVNITQNYNSSSVQSLSSEEIGSGTLSKFAFVSGLGKNKDFYGAHFHTQFGVLSGGSLVTEGLIKDIIWSVIFIILTVIAKVYNIDVAVVNLIQEIVAFFLDMVNVDTFNNTNVHTYAVQMTPTVGEVKGMIGFSAGLTHKN